TSIELPDNAPPGHRHNNRSRSLDLRASSPSNPRFLSICARPRAWNTQHEHLHVPCPTIDCNPARPPLRLAGPVRDERDPPSFFQLQRLRPVPVRTLPENNVIDQDYDAV